jgi:Protein of unknown function (DUF4245)
VQPPTPADPPAAPARPDTGRRPRDMILSLVVLLVPIVLLLAFYRVVLSGDEPMNVDPGAAIQEAQSAKVFPVAVPGGLGDDWHVQTATYRKTAAGSTLRLGYVDPDDDPVQLVESSIDPATLLPTELGEKAEPTGTFRAGNGAWRRYDSRPGEHALVLIEEGRAIVVVGKTDAENLEALATSLA